MEALLCFSEYRSHTQERGAFKLLTMKKKRTIQRVIARVGIRCDREEN